MKMKINASDTSSNPGRISLLNTLYGIILFKLKAKRRVEKQV